MRTVFIAIVIKSEKGNFTCKTTTGDSFFLSKKAAGDTDLSKGFWATVKTNTYNKLGADGKPTTETFQRDDISAFFLNKEDALQAVNAEAIFQIESAALVQTAATAAGLSQTAIDALLEASI